MRLECGDLRWLAQPLVTVLPDDRAGGNVQVGVVPRELLRPADVLGHHILGMKHDTELDTGRHALADGVHVIADPRLLVRGQQLARVVGVDLRTLSRGVLHQEHALVLRAIVRQVVVVLVDGIGKRVVDDPTRAPVHGPRLDRLDVAVLLQTERGIERAEHVGTRRRHLVGWIAHDQIRLADLPDRPVRELRHLRHVSLVAHGRPGVHPGRDRRDLLVAQRNVVLELLDSDVLVDVPGGHLPGDDAVLDRPGPGPHFSVRRQRHRRHLAGAVTDDARVIQDRGDVLGERHVVGRCALGCPDGGCQRQRCDHDREDRTPRRQPPPASHFTFHHGSFGRLSLADH